MSDTILGINFLQILLHAFNLVILVGGLYLLLYKPIQNFVKKREAYYVEQDNNAKQALEDAEKQKADYEEKVANVDKEIADKRTQAAKDTQDMVSSQLDSAKQQADEIVAKARKQAEEEKAKMVEDAQKEIASLAVLATEKLVNESSNMTTVDQFIKAAEGSDD
ncbi:MAG: ATP synthase F0 subunit B [Oscillospiraceae bacterium]|nr:ATP synthase F0 subunit B [Candidatus Ruminococcus equi]